MGFITQRIYQFRGINRSLQPNGLDFTHAYDAVNVEVVGGKLTNAHIGSERLVYPSDLGNGGGRPMILLKPADGKSMYTLTDTEFLISGSYFWELAKNDPYEPNAHYNTGYSPTGRQDIVNDASGGYFLTPSGNYGEGNRYAIRTMIDNDEVILSPFTMKKATAVPYADNTKRTAVYYIGQDGLDYEIHVRLFGSGQFMQKDMSYLSSETDANTGYVTSVTVDKTYTDLTDAEKARAKLDGLWFFDSAIGSTVREDDVDKAYMWMEVTDVISGTGGKAKFTVNTTRPSSDITAGSYTAIRGQCSDIPVMHLQMFKGRLFASAYMKNDNARRLYWSCLPGDGRTIEDWTQTDVSIDTSGGHVDIGDQSDGWIKDLIVIGEQVLIFTRTRLWRLYGSAPSNFTIELVADLRKPKLSDAVIADGTVYWLTEDGIYYYGGSYIGRVEDNDSVKNYYDSLTDAQKQYASRIAFEATPFNNGIMFAASSYRFSVVVNYCELMWFNLRTGDVFVYRIPYETFGEQYINTVKHNFSQKSIYGGGDPVEERLFHTMRSSTKVTMTQWKTIDRQFGWYDGQPVESKWETGWTDLQTPEAVKTVNDVCMRGSGHFELVFESDVNTERLDVTMPENNHKVREAAPHMAQGRTFNMRIESDEPFEIEPFMTMKFETRSLR